MADGAAIGWITDYGVKWVKQKVWEERADHGVGTEVEVQLEEGGGRGGGVGKRRGSEVLGGYVLSRYLLRTDNCSTFVLLLVLL